jgi:ABC-type polysaccharide transport system permease subunit
MKQKSRRIKANYRLFFMVLPFVIFVFAFAYVPIFGWVYGLFNYKPGLSLSEMEFVGLKNFMKIITDWKDLSRVLRNTLVMSGLGLLAAPVPMIFAILLNEIRKPFFRRFVQTTTTLPYFISWIIVFSLSFAIFSNDGLISNILRLLGSEETYTSMLGNNNAVWAFQWILGIWKSVGWNGIIYIAAIAGIDAELYEAARVDGANRFQLIMKITVPSLYPTFFVLLLLSISNLLNNGFEQYFVFFNSLVADRIEVLDYYVYRIGMLRNDIPASTAISMVKTFISVILIFIVNKVAKNTTGSSVI